VNFSETTAVGATLVPKIQQTYCRGIKVWQRGWGSVLVV